MGPPQSPDDQQQQQPHPHLDLSPSDPHNLLALGLGLGLGLGALDDSLAGINPHSHSLSHSQTRTTTTTTTHHHHQPGSKTATNTLNLNQDIIVNPLLLSLPFLPTTSHPSKPTNSDSSSLPNLTPSQPTSISPLLDPCLSAPSNQLAIPSISTSYANIPAQLASSPQQSLSSRPQSTNNGLTPQLVQQSLTPIKVGKNWACRVCRREFTRRYNCTTHERTHLDLRQRAQFQCGLCERAFTRRHDLERHVHSVHPGYVLERDPAGPMSLADRTALDHAPSPPAHGPTSDMQIRPLDPAEPLAAGSSPAEPPEPLTIRSHPLLPRPTPTSSPHCSPPAIDALARPPHKPLESEALPTAIPAPEPLAAGSIRDTSQIVERIPLHDLARENALQEAIFRHGDKWACGTCGRLFVRRNNCKAHEATHRDIRVHQCQTCSRCFSRRHDLERHILAVHPGTSLPPRLESPEFSSRRSRRRCRQSDSWMPIDPSLVELDRAAKRKRVSSEDQEEKHYQSSKASVQAGGEFNIFEAYDVGGAEEEYEDEEEFERYAGGGGRKEWESGEVAVDPRLSHM